MSIFNNRENRNRLKRNKELALRRQEEADAVYKLRTLLEDFREVFSNIDVSDPRVDLEALKKGLKYELRKAIKEENDILDQVR